MKIAARIVVVLTFLLGSVACGPDATPGASTVSAADGGSGGAKGDETLDAEDYCNSEQRSGAKGNDAARAQTAGEWMSKRARTEWFKNLIAKTSSGSLDPVQKDSMLRTDFANRGVTSCPTLDKRDPGAMH